MQIKIFCGCYYPRIHPRAFRAKELAHEFARKGHDVTIVNMSTVADFDYEAYTAETNVKVVNIDILHGRSAKVAASKSSKTRIGRLIRFCIEYFINGNLYGYTKKTVPKLDVLEGADLVIVLSTPFVCFYTLAKYLQKQGKRFVVIGDSGDPFYYSKQTRRAIWFKYIEKNVYKQFDYLTIPTENAIPLYSPLIEKEKIKIIPQGFNMRNLNLYDGKLHDIVNFAYAGVFYWDIRNPSFLFEYLESCDFDYRFNLFMRYEDAHFNQVLEKYPKLKSKTIIKYALPHDDLIFELSKMHFLVNIENISNTQMPSKLIDYGMTGRPILSCKAMAFDSKVMDAFMSGNYDSQYRVNILDYDIDVLTDKFLDLAKPLVSKYKK